MKAIIIYDNEIQIVSPHWKNFQYKSLYKFHSLFSIERCEKILRDNKNDITY